MRMRGHCLRGYGHRLRAAGFRQGKSVSLMDRQSAAQVGQSEGRLAVAAVGRADQVEEGFVLRNRQQLSRAEHPAGRSKIAPKHPDFADIWLGHDLLPCRSWMKAMWIPAVTQPVAIVAGRSEGEG